MIGVGWAVDVGRAIAVADNAMTVAIPMIGEIRTNFIQLTSLFAGGRETLRICDPTLFTPGRYAIWAAGSGCVG
jgi:hypothetical protein